MRLLLMGTAPNQLVGYGKVVKALYLGLKQYPDLEVKVFGLQFVGRQDNPDFLPIGDDIYGSDMLPIYLESHNTDILITIVDHWVPEFQYIPEVVKKFGVKWISQATVNSTPVPLCLYKILKQSHHIVAPSYWVEKELNEVNLKNTTTIYHGVNTDIFKKKQLQPYVKFVFLAVGTNKFGQKNWLGLLKAMHYLVYNLNVNYAELRIVTEVGRRDGIDFPHAIIQSGLQDHVVLIPMIRNNGFGEEQMADIYNSADCYVSSSQGESFGLPHLESMSCGVPAIVPDFSTMKELVERSGAGMTADIIYMLPMEAHISEQALVDPVDMAIKMKQFMEMDRSGMSEKARAFAEQYDWKNIVPHWYNLIKKVSVTSANYDLGELGV